MTIVIPYPYPKYITDPPLLLPEDLVREIYSFDPTYHNIYKNVLKQLTTDLIFMKLILRVHFTSSSDFFSARINSIEHKNTSYPPRPTYFPKYLQNKKKVYRLFYYYYIIATSHN